jgi:valacyclovir hydrolase
MAFIQLPTGARLHYDEAGDSDDVVIALHGMLGTPQRELAQLMDWLKPKYRVLAPTLRGYGQSEPKPRDFPLNFLQRDADDVLAFMAELKVERAHLLGYSDGGEVALLCAGTQPERFRSVAVWGSVGYYGPEMRPIAQSLYPGDWITDDQLALHSIPNRDAFALGWVNAVKYLIDSGGDVSLSLAESITCPVLLMLGEKDRLNPQAYGQKFINHTQYGQLQMLPGGHAVHFEQWERFQRVVGKFLTMAEAQ